MKLCLNFNTKHKLPLIFRTSFDRNFRKHSELSIPEPLLMATCVSFYIAVGNLDIYSILHKLSSLDSLQNTTVIGFVSNISAVFVTI